MESCEQVEDAVLPENIASSEDLLRVGAYDYGWKRLEKMILYYTGADFTSSTAIESTNDFFEDEDRLWGDLSFLYKHHCDCFPVFTSPLDSFNNNLNKRKSFFSKPVELEDKKDDSDKIKITE